MATRPRVHEFDVTVDRDRVARSALGGSPLPREAEWWAEHYVLAGLVRCTLASMDYAARRAGSNVDRLGNRARRRDEARGGRALRVRRDRGDVRRAARSGSRAGERSTELLGRAEAGCFVGNSLTAKTRYHWIVNGEEVR